MNYLYYSIKSVAENSLYNKIIFLILQTIVQFITYLLIAIYLIHFSQQIQQIYLFYFEISAQSIRSVVSNCEKFLTLLNFGDEEQEEEQDENYLLSNQEQEEFKMLNKKNKKTWKISNSKFQKLMITSFFIFLMIQIYFVYQYFSAQQVVQDTFNLCPILNTTSLMESEYRLGDNAIREYIINPDQKIFGIKKLKILTIHQLQILFKTTSKNCMMQMQTCKLNLLKILIYFSKIILTYFSKYCLVQYYICHLNITNLRILIISFLEEKFQFILP